MTRINGSFRTHSRALAPISAQRNGPRGTVVEAELVLDDPIEEVSFDGRAGAQHRDHRRNTAAGSLREEVLQERVAGGRAHTRRAGDEKFWQRFSSPFMAQMIGQSSTTYGSAAAGYKSGGATPDLPRISKAV